MLEASPVKFYLAKYVFLLFAVLQWCVAAFLLLGYALTARSFFIALIFFTFGGVLFFLYTIVSHKIRRVAIGKNKIVIIDGHRNTRFEWPEVKSLRMLPFLSLYKLKIKGKKGSIYFFPSGHVDPSFGGLLGHDGTRMGSLVAKRKKQFGIK